MFAIAVQQVKWPTKCRIIPRTVTTNRISILKGSLTSSSPSPTGHNIYYQCTSPIHGLQLGITPYNGTIPICIKDTNDEETDYSTPTHSYLLSPNSVGDHLHLDQHRLPPKTRTSAAWEDVIELYPQSTAATFCLCYVPSLLISLLSVLDPPLSQSRLSVRAFLFFCEILRI